MSAEQNEAMVRAIFASMDRNKNMDALDEYAASNYAVHLPGAPPMDKEGMKQFAKSFFQAIPDLSHDIKDLMATNDRVALRLRLYGKHTKDLVGPNGTIPPSGRDVDFEALNIWKIEGGKAVEHWIMYDVLGFLQQVGAIPAG